MAFVHLHTHTEQGGFDAFGSVRDFVKLAAERGDPAIATTEHGTVRGLYELEKIAGEYGIKPIFGCEFYLAHDMRSRGLTKEETQAIRGSFPKGTSIKVKNEAVYREEVKRGLRAREHLILLAMNEAGLRNLFRLSTLGYLEGFYHRPRIDLPALEQHAEGLIALSACLQGVVARPLLLGNVDRAIEVTERMAAMFPGRFYLELMPHSMADQQTVNLALADIAQAFGLPLVATQDAHYPTPADRQHQEVMLAIYTHTVMMNPARFRLQTDDFWFRSEAEMREAFDRFHPGLPKALVHTAMETTLEVAERCRVALPKSKPLVPRPNLPPEVTDVDYLRVLCDRGWSERDLDRVLVKAAEAKKQDPDERSRIYRDRLAHELRVLEERGIVDYFLAVYDLYEWARSQDIMMGPGRGSVAGSLVAYLLGITQVDPIAHGLLFERFLAPGRIDMPDIDIDVMDTRRDEVLAYLQTKYGEKQFARISTTQVMRGRACLRDVGRVFQIPGRILEDVAACVPEKYLNEEEKEPVLHKIVQADPTVYRFGKLFPPAMESAISLEGGVRAFGVHPAGVVIAPTPLIDICPLELRKSRGDMLTVTAFDMRGVEALGLLKLDVLSLRNLTVVHQALKAIAERRGRQIDLTKIRLDDRRVLSAFSKQRFVGIFQFDTPLTYRMTRDFHFDSFDDIAAMGAITRPGVSHSGLAEEYLRRKRDKSYRPSMHPIIDEICKDTLGVMVFQEHVIRILRQLGGFSPEKADKVRKMIGKKLGREQIEGALAEFVTGATAAGAPADVAERVAETMVHMGSYAFNKAHATSYGLIAYWEMWLKVHYPGEFIWALLCSAKSDEDRVSYIDEAVRLGLRVWPPDVNVAGVQWAVVEGGLVMPLLDLKGVGVATIEAIEASRPFADFIDFVARSERRRINRRVVKIFLETGALRNLVPNQKWLFEHLDALWDGVGKDGWEARMAEVLLQSMALPEWSEEERRLLAKKYIAYDFGRDVPQEEKIYS